MFRWLRKDLAKSVLRRNNWKWVETINFYSVILQMLKIIVMNNTGSYLMRLHGLCGLEQMSTVISLRCRSCQPQTRCWGGWRWLGSNLWDTLDNDKIIIVNNNVIILFFKFSPISIPLPWSLQKHIYSRNKATYTDSSLHSLAQQRPEILIDTHVYLIRAYSNSTTVNFHMWK